MERTKYLRIEIKEPAQRTAVGKMLKVDSWGLRGLPAQGAPSEARDPPSCLQQPQEVCWVCSLGCSRQAGSMVEHRPLTLMPPRFLSCRMWGVLLLTWRCD